MADLMKGGLRASIDHLIHSSQGGMKHFMLTYNHGDYIVTEDGKIQLMQYALSRRLVDTGFDVYVWSFAKGLKVFMSNNEKVHRLNNKYNLKTGPPNPDADPLGIFRTEFPKMEALLRNRVRRSAMIIRYVEHLVESGDSYGSYEKKYLTETLLDWALSPGIKASENLVILFAKDGSYDKTLEEGWEVIPVPLPNQEERHKLILSLNNQGGDNNGQDEECAQEIACHSNGLRMKTLLNLYQQEHEGISIADVKRAKQAEIHQLSGGRLEVVESDVCFDDVAGLEYVKHSLEEVLTQMRKGGRSSPRGLMFVGPPGTGKSLMAEAFANESDFVFVNLRDVRSKWVGESERNMDRVLHVLESLAPCIVAIDEIDQQMMKRGHSGQGDSGVSSRLFARLLEFLGTDKYRGKVLFIGMSNFPTLLDPAIVDRFSKVIPFFHLQAQEYAALIGKACEKENIRFEDDVDINACGSMLVDKMISPRRVVDIIYDLKASKLFQDENDLFVTQDDLIGAIGHCLNNHNPLQIERMTLEAVRMASSVRQLPWFNNQSYEFHDWLKPHIDQETGIPDFSSIDDRLRELAHVF